MPTWFDETYLPLSLGMQIVHNDLRLHPIFTLLEEEFGAPLVEVGSPIFQSERTSMTTGNQPVDYQVVSYRGDLVRIVTKLLRQPGNSARTQALRSRKR
jgi:GntR family transcriptional regulator